MPILSTVLLGALVAYDLRCESLTDPLVVQPVAPSLSWKVKSTTSGKQNLRQTGYRVLVASDLKLLGKDKGDLWDTGRVISSETYGIRYQGKSLGSRSKCWWKVQVWDQDGQISGWSKPGYFGIGLQKESDWKGEWIYSDAPKNVVNPLKDASWIGSASVSDFNKAPAGTYKYRFDFEWAEGKVKLWLTADNTYSARINGTPVSQTTDPEGWRKIQNDELTSGLKPGKNSLEIDVTNVGAGPTGLLACLFIELPSGDVVKYHSNNEWSCDGVASKVFGKNGIAPWGSVSDRSILVSPAQYFRKQFRAEKRIRRATAYVTALGIVDFTVNGKRVTEDLFTPGWTNYNKRLHYRAFDVTKNLQPGDNEVGAILGQGWYSGYIAWGMQREHYGSTPMLKAQVEVEYEDGTTSMIHTGEDWAVSHAAILDEHFLHGEKYDARVTPSKWSRSKVGQFKTLIEAFPGEPVRAYQNVQAKSVLEVAGKTFQIDFGQNLSGFVKLKVNEPAGTVITIRHAERLDKDGRIYTTNLRAAQAIDTYTCKGGGVEEWNPRFTFHGFQYIEVTGMTQKPNLKTFTAVAISSATPEAGTLETSDPMMNKLVSNAWWTQKMNFIDVPTDCPQRDERLGWTGDAQAYIQTATYYSDVHSFFNKWLVTLDDDQREDGQYPKVAPVLKGLDDGGPAWSDAGVICPMTIYDMYGDEDLLARHFPNMERYIEFCRKRSQDNLLPPKDFHCFGDWLSINANTPNEVIAQAYFAESTRLVARAASILGKADKAKQYQELYAKVRQAFLDNYVSPEGKVRGETQCGYVLALAFDLLDAKRTKLAEKHLVDDIEKRGWRLSTGFVGTRDIMQALAKIGRYDVAFRLLHNTTFPSWGFTIVNGATSIWERWDGWTPEKGFQDAGMNSFAHYAYGAVVGWMFKEIGGISPAEPGFKKVRIAPKFDANLNWAKCNYNSIRGPIHTEWKRVGKSVEVTIEIPPNATAEIFLPGEPFTKEVGSGVWKFSVAN